MFYFGNASFCLPEGDEEIHFYIGRVLPLGGTSGARSMVFSNCHHPTVLVDVVYGMQKVNENDGPSLFHFAVSS